MKHPGRRPPRSTIALDALASVRLAGPALVVVVLLLVAACGSTVSTPTPRASASPSSQPTASSASPVPSPSGGTPSGLEDELKAAADRIASEVATLRDLALLSPVKTEVFDQAALDAYVLADFDKETPAKDVEAQQGLYRRLGLLSSTASLRDLTVDLLTSQVLGFYDPEDATFRVVARSDGIGGLEKITMSHELTHALQDQHFDLDVLLPPELKEQSDLALARRAVAEGDATLLMTQWATTNLTPQELLETVQAASDPAQQAILARTPPILTEPLQFPYVQGLQFVMDAWGSGGWAAVDGLYARPPDTTEQVLHPEKYAAREAPVAVSLDDALPGLHALGWTEALQDTFGEYLVSLWLQEAGTGMSPATADAAAAGWGGDRLAYLTGPDGADAVVWRTAWDSEADAGEFRAAADSAVGALAPDATKVVGDPRDDRTVWVVIASSARALCQVTASIGLGGDCLD